MRTILLILTVLICSCCSMKAISKDTKVDIRGQIKHMSMRDDRKFPASILVEGKLEKDTSYDKASIRISIDTVIYDERSGKKQKAGIKSLKLDQKVEAKFTGPVAESYPVQAQAESVTILDD